MDLRREDETTKLLVATNNPGNLREFQTLLADVGIAITSPAAEGIHLDVEETGNTYLENATIKALAFARSSGLPTVADDSGLEIDALGGRPGVNSARFGGPGATDRDRLLLVLNLLAQVPLEQRTARFRAVVVLAKAEGVIVYSEGITEGIVSFAPEGSRGFGYDPIFYLPRYGRTMAQIPPSVKNRLSHRARAIRKLKNSIRTLLS